MAMIRVMFSGGPYAGVHRVAETPPLLILTMAAIHHVYQRVIDPDTGEYLDLYEFHSTRYGGLHSCIRCGVELDGDDASTMCEECIDLGKI